MCTGHRFKIVLRQSSLCSGPVRMSPVVCAVLYCGVICHYGKIFVVTLWRLCGDFTKVEPYRDLCLWNL